MTCAKVTVVPTMLCSSYIQQQAIMQLTASHHATPNSRGAHAMGPRVHQAEQCPGSPGSQQQRKERNGGKWRSSSYYLTKSCQLKFNVLRGTGTMRAVAAGLPPVDDVACLAWSTAEQLPLCQVEWLTLPGGITCVPSCALGLVDADEAQIHGAPAC